MPRAADSRGSRSYTGIEPDEQSRSVAIQRVGAAARVLVDENQLGLNETFDLVCAFEVLEHIEDETAALNAWTKRIRPGGHLLISVPAWQHRYGPMDAEVGHFRRYDPDHLATVLTTTGLQTVRTIMYGWPLAYALEGVRNRMLHNRENKIKLSPMESRSHGSGRSYQPRARIAGLGTAVLSFPFRCVQRLQKHRGTGLVVLARQPS